MGVVLRLAVELAVAGGLESLGGSAVTGVWTGVQRRRRVAGIA